MQCRKSERAEDCIGFARGGEIEGMGCLGETEEFRYIEVWRTDYSVALRFLVSFYLFDIVLS